jgi:hypothetical protein
MRGSVQSILARCIVDVRFLDLLTRDREKALHGYDLNEEARRDFRSFDIERLRRFSGLITKVQNNGLWQPIPQTRALLNYYCLESDVFVAYTDIHQRNRAVGAISRNEQTLCFLNFLRSYLESQRTPVCLGLSEVLAHERIQWEIERFSQSSDLLPSRPVELPASADDFRRLVPTIRGTLRVEAFSCNPLEVISALEAGRFRPEHVSSQELLLGYWGDRSQGALRILKLDSLTGALLSQVNGRRSLRRIANRVFAGATDRPRPRALRSFFEDAFHQGLLAIESCPRG